MDLTAQRHNFSVGQLLLLVFICARVALGQDPQISQMTAPPPIRIIPKQERLQIEQASDTKQRLRVTIELSSSHLNNAEKQTSQQNYEEASAEIGIYHALIEHALTALASLKRDSNKTRDLYKRLELALRSDGPRLTAMRRTTPIEFAVRIKEVEDFAREGRTEALNSFYGHTVVRDPQKTDDVKRLVKPNEETPPKSKTP